MQALELNYNLKEEDYLNFQLYYASNSPQIKKQRKIGRFLVLTICMMLGGLFLYSGNQFVGIYFLVAGAICGILYQKYSAWFYKRVFKKHVSRTYAKITPMPTHLLIENGTIKLTDSRSKSEIDASKLLDIVETEQYLFIRFSEIQYIVIPKSELENIDFIRSVLTDFASEFKLNFKRDLLWRWK